jgi:hypothetical protein
MSIAQQTKIGMLPFEEVTSKSELTELRVRKLAEYDIIYHINDCYSIKHISKFTNKNQVLFQKFGSKIHQLNLALVDTSFPLILADVALEVFLNKVSTFDEYTGSLKKLTFLGYDLSVSFLKYKLSKLLHCLLYSELSTDKVYNGEIHTNRVHRFENELGKIEVSSFLEQERLLSILKNHIKLDFISESTFVYRNDVKIRLQISIL